MALSADTPLIVAEGIFGALPLLASQTVYEGSMCGLSTGYARALTAGDPFMGHALRKVVDASGVSAAENVTIRKGPYCAQVTLTGVAVTDVGKEVFASDDATLTLVAAGNSRVGIVIRYVTTNTAIVQFEPLEVMEACQGVEFDCGLGAAAAAVVLIPACANPNGLVIEAIYGIVTEQAGGGTEDQGVVTVSDESNNSLATLTFLDAGADAVGDVLEGYFIHEASDGEAGVLVAAGEFVDAIVTTLTSGTSLAGKIKVFIVARPYNKVA